MGEASNVFDSSDFVVEQRQFHHVEIIVEKIDLQRTNIDERG